MAWHGKEFEQKFNREMQQRLYRAASFLETEVKKTIGIVAPPASEPGDPPHLRTGELRRSITKEVDGESLQARIGTNKSYAGFLERGTSEMEPRPYLKPILEINKGVVAHILAGKKLT